MTRQNYSRRTALSPQIMQLYAGNKKELSFS